MKYGIIGAGGIGGYFGGRLARVGLDVHFLLRSDYDYVKEHGLYVDSVNGSFHLNKVNAYASPEDMPVCDVILVCTKTTANGHLHDILSPITGRDTLVIQAQNGLGMEDDLHKMMPGIDIAGGTMFICAEKSGPGHIVHHAFGELTIAPQKNCSVDLFDRRAHAMAEDFDKAGIDRLRISHDLNGIRWKKLVWNMPYNGMSVTEDCMTDLLTFDPILREKVKAEMKEVILAANACGVAIGMDHLDKMITFTEGMKPYKPSMRLDYDAGREMETHYMYERPIEAAAAAGFDMRCSRAILEELKKKTASRAD